LVLRGRGKLDCHVACRIGPVNALAILPAASGNRRVGDAGARRVTKGPEAVGTRWSKRALAALHPELLAYARSLTLDTAAAEDLVHDALLRAFQSDTAPRDPDELRPWAFRVLKNLFLDVQRRHKVRVEHSRSQAQLTSGQRAPDPVEILVVRQAYGRLSPRDREILCLIDILGFTYAEASRIIDIPMGTVMSRISRARRSMIELMQESNVRPFRKSISK